MQKKQLPRGLSNYRELVISDSYYIDRTMYFDALEKAGNPFLFFLRPRKFGKSLFLSSLHFYYGIEFKDQFEQLFGSVYVGKNPTGKANSYYVLRFDFSNIQTSKTTSIETEFLTKVKNGIEQFFSEYQLVDKETVTEILSQISANAMISVMGTKVMHKIGNTKIFVLVDEYDQFTNELISFDLNQFRTIVSGSGYVRKFFEAIKELEGLGIVGRFFATGVTPVTLDSMTSGFNIATNLTLDAQFNEMLGFTEEEVDLMLRYYEIENHQKVLSDMREYYNGSLFSKKATTRLYNSNMVMYFVDSLLRSGSYPDPIVDYNILSDYSKINNIFSLGDVEENEERIQEILRDGETLALITHQFTFERRFNSDDLISLLFYNGLLTIKGEHYGRLKFGVPNYAIGRMYWTYYSDQLQERFGKEYQTRSIHLAIEEMAIKGAIDLFVEQVSSTLNLLSNRDLMNFDEKYIKMVFLVLSSISPLFIKKSEPELNRLFPDILFLNNPSAPSKYQILFEIKYLKIREKQRILDKLSEASDQIRKYKSLDEIKMLKNLKCYAIVFVGTEGHFELIED